MRRPLTPQERRHDLREREAGALRPPKQARRAEEGDPPLLAAAVRGQENHCADGRRYDGSDEGEVGDLHPGDMGGGIRGQRKGGE